MIGYLHMFKEVIFITSTGKRVSIVGDRSIVPSSESDYMIAYEDCAAIIDSINRMIEEDDDNMDRIVKGKYVSKLIKNKLMVKLK